VATSSTATAAVRGAGAPPLVMTYWNLVLRRGVERFAADLAAAGGAGSSPRPDPRRGRRLDRRLRAHRPGPGLPRRPVSTPERLAFVTDKPPVASCMPRPPWASPAPVTSLGSAAAELVARARAVSDLPVCVGLGVSTRSRRPQVGSFADGVIVGSALVSTMLDTDRAAGLDRLAALTRDLAAGVREGRADRQRA
jgi:tryptophan synthase alpha chain